MHSKKDERACYTVRKCTHVPVFLGVKCMFVIKNTKNKYSSFLGKNTDVDKNIVIEYWEKCRNILICG